MSKLIFIALTLSIFGLWNCSAPMPLPEGVQIFRYNESAGISSLDPAMARDQANIWAVNQIFNGLVQLDDKLLVKPSLASHWDISTDGRTYTFYLRTDVFFHPSHLFPQGRKFTAQDMEYSLQRILNPKTMSPGAVWLNELIDTLSHQQYWIQARNDSVLEIKLKAPFAPFLSRLSMPYFSAVPKEVVAFYGADFGRNPIGTGPFTFKLWKEGVKLVLLKNPNYFEKENGESLPFLDAVAISFIIDKQSVFLEFIKGNIDFMSGIDATYKDELLQADGSLQPKYKSKVVMTTSPYLNTEYLGFLSSDSSSDVLQNPWIRKAINLGFDRVKMMRYLRNNIGIAGEYGMVPVGMAGFEPQKEKFYTYLPDSALKLLALAGYPNGKGLPEISLSTVGSYLDISKYMQQELAKIGIRIKIDVHQPGALRQMIAQGKIPFFRGSWIADYADPENYLSLFYSPNAAPAGANYTLFHSQQFDQLYRQAQTQTNDSLRMILYQKMNKLVSDQAPVVVLYYDQALRFTSPKISGLGINSMNLLNLKRVKKQR